MKTNLINSIKEAAKKVTSNNIEEKAQIALILAVLNVCDVKTLEDYLNYIISIH